MVVDEGARIQHIQWINGGVLWNLFSLTLPLLPRYKSNEEYVYVRGRGRGKYICGECGIRCKKPSMLKKHIRTHTDVRPYVCKHCNFAFKTKGGWTKQRERLLVVSLWSPQFAWLGSGEHQYSVFWVSSSQETLPNTWNQRPTGKNVRQWECLSHRWMIRRARKQVLVSGLDRHFTFLPPSCTVENIGTQLDELPVKARSCSTLAAYATLCSILLPLALHKKCEKVINKEHRTFDSFLQECALFSRVHGIFSLLLFEASYLTGFSPAFPFDSHLFLADKLPGTSSTFLK